MASFEDFRATAKKNLGAQELLDIEIRRARRDIEKGEEELADPEGIVR